MIGPGDHAPDFTLDGTEGPCTLSGLRGRPVVLAFYPGDDTPVCTRQLTSYDDQLPVFERHGAQLLGISPQDLASHRRFADQHGFRFPLLVDRDKAVGATYGILGPLGFYRRSIVVVDADGVVQWAHRALTGATFRKVDELGAVLERLASTS